MVWQANVNIGPTDCDEGFFELKEHMKANGFTLQGSGDGDSNFDNSGTDVITGPGSGANGIANDNSWWRIQAPDGQREFLFVRAASSSGSWDAYYSVSAGFTGGTPDANTRPTATDENFLGDIANSTSSTLYFHMAVQDTAVNGVYAWWFVGRQQTSGDSATILFCEAMDSIRSGDTDPLVMNRLGNDPSTAEYDDTTADSPRGYVDHGGPEQAWVGWPFAYISGSGDFTLSMSTDEDGNDTLLPIPAVRIGDNNYPNGVKGVCAHLRYIATSSRVYPDIIDVSGGEIYLVVGALAVPGWPSTGTTPAT